MGREFNEVKAELTAKGEDFSWEIARVRRGAFDIDEKDLYVIRDKESSKGERKLVLAYLCKPKTKGGNKNGV